MDRLMSLIEIWKEFAKSKRNLILLVLSFITVILALHFAAIFITAIEHRTGFSFRDPILALLPTFDLTWLIFSVLYFSVFFAFFHLLPSPQELILGFFSYSLLLSFRILCMYLLPLDPPKDMILLKDPIIEGFGTDITLTRDLFFSGHTSLMVLLFLLAKKRYAKILLLVGTFIVGFGVMLQKVHYSVDVVVAIFVAYCSYSWMKKILVYARILK
ncbi:MAG: phosphatase PAP2-related protein [Candidatus Kapaibacteriota bacterium]